MSNIVNALTTTNLSEQLKPDIASKIALITPWMSTPLTSMLFKMNFFNMVQEHVKGSKTPSDLMTIEKTTNQSFSDFEAQLLAKVTAVTDGGTADGSATPSNNTLEVTDATIFKVGDVIAISEVTTGTRREVDYVYSIDYTTNMLTLTRDVLTDAVATIAATDLVYKVANAAGEGSGTPSILTAAKTKVTNYVQNFKTTWGMTEQQMKSGTWTENEMLFQKKVKLMELWEEIESALWQGIPAFQTLTDADGNKVSTTGGVFDGIRNGSGAVTDAGTNIIKSELDALIKATYTSYGQSVKGRVLMCSADAVSDIDAIISTTNGYNLNVNAGDNIKAGYSVPFYKTSFTPDGGIPVLHSPVFDRAGIKGAVLLDLDTIKLKEFIPFRIDKLILTNNEQQEKEGVVGEYGLSRVAFQKNGYLKITGSTEPIS